LEVPDREDLPLSARHPVEMKPPAQRERLEREEPFDHGIAWVRDGRIGVKDPAPGGPPAQVVPAGGMELLVSGRKIEGPAEVTESTPIEIRFPNEEPQVSYSVSIAENGLSAQLTIEAKDGIRYRLKDMPPARYLKLEIEKETFPAQVDPTEVVKFLQEKGINYGIDHAACIRACLEKPPNPVTLAQGKPFTPGQDGRIEFSVALEKIVELPLEDLRVDFRETVRIPDVKPGQVIAVKHPPLPGAPGIAVTGKLLYPPRPKDPRFRAGKGVEIREEEGRLVAYALMPGLPRFTQGTGIVEVDPVFRHKGDVGLSSGNIRFSGKVEIAGNVTEGATVQCEGDQEIHGSVTGANLRAWGSIKIDGNVFKSGISAGKDTTYVRKWDVLLRNVEEYLDAIMEICSHDKKMDEVANAWSDAAHDTEIDEVDMGQASQDAGSEKEASKVPEHLDVTNSEHSGLADKFRQMVIALSTLFNEDLSKLPKEIADSLYETRDLLLDSSLDLFSRARLVSERLSALRVWIEEENSKGQSDVTVPYVQSSTIEAARDIVITGQGAFYSTLVAGRAVKVQGNPGLVRGSEISAGELIKANVAGGQGPAPTVMRVPEKGKIVAGVVYPNTILVVGRHKIRAENTLESLEARVVDGELVISSKAGTVKMD